MPMDLLMPSLPPRQQQQQEHQKQQQQRGQHQRGEHPQSMPQILNDDLLLSESDDDSDD